MQKLSVIATNACGWPNLTKLPSGRVLCTYFNAPSHGLLEGDLVCSISNRKGSGWKNLSTVASRPKGGNRMHLAVGIAGNGDLLCFSSGFYVEEEEFKGFSGHWLSRSSDAGKNWSVDPDPIVHKGNRGTIPFGRIIRLADNRLAYTCYLSQGKGNPSETWMGISEDDGMSWKKRVKLGRNDSNEATLLQVGDGRVLAAVRTHVDHHVKLCESSNLGATWREKGPLTLPMQHPADLIALSDKCLLLTYGIRNRGLMGIGVRISLDGGGTWRPPWVIHQFGNQATDIGYPSSVTLDKKGNLLTAFYTDYEPSLGKRAARYRVLAMRWSIKDWLHKSLLSSISDGKQLKV
jgi:hypothetical protein